MKTITFDAHLIEMSDMEHVHDHILENAPCVAWYQIIYPQGNRAWFVAAVDSGTVHATSIGRQLYETILRINQPG